MATGRIKLFYTELWPSKNNGKGFGFIAQVGGPDVFVHAKALVSLISILGEDNLRGVEVEFEIAEGLRGPEAVNVRRPGDVISPVAAVPSRHIQVTAGTRAVSADKAQNIAAEMKMDFDLMKIQPDRFTTFTMRALRIKITVAEKLPQ